MKPRVFVPMVPSRFDRDLRTWVPSVDIHAAERHGEIVIMLPPDASKAGPAPCVAAMREKMATMTAEEDSLLAVGDPSLIAAAAALASRVTGGVLRVLKWDRYTRDYLAVEMKI